MLGITKKYQNEQSEDDQLAYGVAENNARHHKLGLFQNSNQIKPWDWRKLSKIQRDKFR